VSLITPCVFPMIPITVSFFLKQAEKPNGKPVLLAMVYSGTIIAILTVAAVALLSLFQWLSVNPIMNFAIGGLFVYFALSLFGMYEIELPSFLARFTSSREGQGGLLGTVFMALTFTILSFACVAPFLGGFGGTAAGGEVGLLHRILGGLAFATTFAAPFFLLALFPTLLKKLPQSGSWLNSVKVVMGFLELAAAFKFLRAGELVMQPRATIFTFDLVLGVWVALAVLCGFYLLNLYRLPHDEPADHITVPRLLLGAGFLGLAFYMLPALFKVGLEGEAQRPAGTLYAWVNSFLLPEPSEGKASLSWSGNLKQALDDARGKSGLVFVDFTAKNCTNCKLNEDNIFTKPEVKSLLEKYHRVQLYQDYVPNEFYSSAARARFGSGLERQEQDGVVNREFESKAFNTIQRPLYAILQSRPNNTIAVLGVYGEGTISNQAEFVQFLQKPLEAK
jgi:thiol:disulfide interchange protein